VQHHVATSGWFYREWKGAFYPDDLPSSRWFYGRHSKEELADWFAKISASGAKEVFVYFNTTADGSAITNACALTKMFSENFPAQ
jgi:uncharacterized protein YecE (DUF72 family)